LRLDDPMIMSDCLADQKQIMEEYNNAIMESATNELRHDLLSIYQDESAIQRDIFQSMLQRGLYSVPTADTQSLLELHNRYSQQLQTVGR